jgi:hypothetical protein
MKLSQGRVVKQGRNDRPSAHSDTATRSPRISLAYHAGRQGTQRRRRRTSPRPFAWRASKQYIEYRGWCGFECARGRQESRLALRVCAAHLGTKLEREGDAFVTTAAATSADRSGDATEVCITDERPYCNVVTTDLTATFTEKRVDAGTPTTIQRDSGGKKTRKTHTLDVVSLWNGTAQHVWRVFQFCLVPSPRVTEAQ